MFLALWDEFFGSDRSRKLRPSQLAQAAPAVVEEPVPMALPVPEDQPEPAPMASFAEAPAVAAPVLPPPRRFGTASHLRKLTYQERLQVLLGQLSALMDSKDEDDWTINPAYHPEVNAYIEKHGNFPQFVSHARALQKNRAPYYSKMVVPGPRRKTILANGRTTLIH